MVPQASAVSAKSSSKVGADFAESTFAQALAVAGFSPADTSNATSLSAASKPVSVTPRAARNTKPQAKQEATQATTTAAATIAVSVPAPAAAPLENIGAAFSWDREESVRAEQPSATESAETSQSTSPRGNSASTPAQPATGGATQSSVRWSADTSRRTSNQPTSESAPNEDSVPPAAPAQTTSFSEANPTSVSASSSISAPQSSESQAVAGTAAASSRAGKFGTSTSFQDVTGSGFVQAMAAVGFNLPGTTSDTSLSSASQPVNGISRAQANAQPQAKPEVSTATEAAPAIAPAAASPAGQSVQAQSLASVLAQAVPSATPTQAAAPAAAEDRQARAVSGQSFAARAAYAWQPTITASQTSASASAPADLAIAARVQPAGEQISATRAAGASRTTAPAAQTSASASTSDSANAAPVQTATGTADRRAAQREAPAAEQASSRRTVESSSGDSTVAPPAAASSGSSAASYAHAFVQAEGPSTDAASSATQEPAAASAAPAEASTIPEAKLTSASAPLKDISIQVAQPGAQKVEVRVVQQSGELRVAVRTGDSDLAHGLQQNLSDLVGRLQESGFRAEGWRPAGSTVESPAPSDTRTTSNTPSRNGNQQSNSGGSQGQEGERQQSRSQRPAWLEELETSINGNEWSQGASYGIGS